MADILHEMDVEASPADVYNALTRQEQLAAWWTQHTVAEPVVGSTAEFAFSGGAAVFKFNIDRLDEGDKVYWSVKGGPPGWENTRVTWDLASGENGGTKITFGHRDWASTAGSFASVSFNWAYFMMSLKAYLETGTGMPHTDADMPG